MMEEIAKYTLVVFAALIIGILHRNQSAQAGEPRVYWLALALIAVGGPVAYQYSTNWATSINYLAVSLVVSDILARSRRPEQTSRQATLVLALMATLYAWMLAATLRADGSTPVHALTLPLFAFAAILHPPKPEVGRRTLALFITIAVTGSLLAGYSSTISAIAHPRELILGKDRLGGLWGSPHTVVFASVILAALVFRLQMKPLWRGICLAISTIAFIVGGSRGAQLPALVAISVTALATRKKFPFGRRCALAIGGIAASVSFAWLLFNTATTYNPRSLTGRSTAWPIIWTRAKDSLPWGAGLNAMRGITGLDGVSRAFNSPHNGFIALLLYGGIPAAVIGIFILTTAPISLARRAESWLVFLAIYIPLSLMTETRFSFEGLGLVEAVLILLAVHLSDASQKPALSDRHASLSRSG